MLDQSVEGERSSMAEQILYRLSQGGWYHLTYSLIFLLMLLLKKKIFYYDTMIQEITVISINHLCVNVIVMLQ